MPLIVIIFTSTVRNWPVRGISLVVAIVKGLTIGSIVLVSLTLLIVWLVTLFSLPVAFTITVEAVRAGVVAVELRATVVGAWATRVLRFFAMLGT